MSFSTQDSDEVLSEMNVTPLVDVMLVLLVVFIVTTPLMTNAIKINLPKTDAVAPAEQKDPVVVSVDQDGKFYLDKSQVEVDLLEKSLGDVKLKDPEVRVQLQADEGGQLWSGGQGHGLHRAFRNHQDFRDDLSLATDQCGETAVHASAWRATGSACPQKEDVAPRGGTTRPERLAAYKAITTLPH